ncbi:RteC domain-containing protein [Capnocytophaga canimorsus]|uniref:RteC domain-containing protein n=1 Tax=Capnocytophaga canimorsus TaxID=28188 RepID=UPI000D6DCD74|nr:RteC domain-containing protein [Capnocytophaga canimorsus]AWL79341.1 hypothetical protein DKB58_10530 [Capnocytophaga canimorsus]AYW35917.1 hypothetical protein D8L92_00215 [Capnocytophaga canimorsus]MDT9498795.1 RteC domain-containing protein [Capnocytophaga canimorsus]
MEDLSIMFNKIFFLNSEYGISKEANKLLHNRGFSEIEDILIQLEQYITQREMYVRVDEESKKNFYKDFPNFYIQEVEKGKQGIENLNTLRNIIKVKIKEIQTPPSFPKHNYNVFPPFWETQLTSIVSKTESHPQNIKPLQWKGEAIELAELVQALIESKLLNPELTQKEIYSRFKAFFEIDFDHEDKKKKIKNRTNTLTPFLEKLMISVENFITGKD